jgi:putative Holliday junction resolvase
MRYIGIDYGTKRVGIAISDEAGEFAFPKGIVDTDTALEMIAHMCVDEKIDAVVIGESLATNEVDNALLSKTQTFKAKLATTTGLPIFFEREGFSTVEAHRYQIDAGKRDDSAAAIILQRFLDKRAK